MPILFSMTDDGNLRIPIDGERLFFGQNDSAQIYYDGSDLQIGFSDPSIGELTQKIRINDDLLIDGGLTVGSDIVVDGDITADTLSLDLDGTASFTLTKRAGVVPAFVSDIGTAGLGQFIEFYSVDGDVTKDSRLRFFGKGTISSAIEGLQIGWDPVNLEYYINTDKSGGGTVYRPLDLYATTSNQGQLLLNIDGTVDINSVTIDINKISTTGGTGMVIDFEVDDFDDASFYLNGGSEEFIVAGIDAGGFTSLDVGNSAGDTDGRGTWSFTNAITTPGLKNSDLSVLDIHPDCSIDGEGVTFFKNASLDDETSDLVIYGFSKSYAGGTSRNLSIGIDDYGRAVFSGTAASVYFNTSMGMGKDKILGIGNSFLTFTTGLGSNHMRWYTHSNFVGDTAIIGIMNADQKDYNFGYPEQDDTEIRLHSNDSSQTKYLSLKHNGTDGVIATGEGDLKLGDAGNINIDSNSNRLFFGENQESFIYYDSSDLRIGFSDPSTGPLTQKVRINDDLLVDGILIVGDGSIYEIADPHDELNWRGSNGQLVKISDKTGIDLFKVFDDDGAAVLTVVNDGGVFLTGIKSGSTQGAAGAAANELWHDTDDNTIKIGV